MKIAVGNDHRGVAVKQRVLALLAELGHEVISSTRVLAVPSVYW